MRGPDTGNERHWAKVGGATLHLTRSAGCGRLDVTRGEAEERMATVEQVTQPASQPGNGKPSDLASAFTDALVSAVRAQESAAAEAHVAAAITLGWYVAALAHPGHPRQTAAAARGDLGPVAAITDAQMVDFCASHAKVAFAKLADLVAKATLTLPAGQLEECLAAADAAARRGAAADLDSKALAVLSATDMRLGKAYAVGRALLTLTSRPDPDATLKSHLTGPAVAPLVAAIDDLGSALAPHAGHSVRASILEWRASIETRSPVAAEKHETWLQLARQGELWRALLSGEKSGTDMLEIDDYLDAAERLSCRMRKLTGAVLRRFWFLVIVIVALFGGGVALIVATDTDAAVVAGAGTILASLGLTWRGLGRSLGALAAKLERPLWGAELDTAITQAITLLPREKGRDTTEQRRKVAVALGDRE
jgi:hypothetical protein